MTRLIVILYIYLLVALTTTEYCSLESLYEDIDTQLVLREHLNNLFENKFIQALNNSKQKAPYLIAPAHRFKKDLKKYFIIFGFSLNNAKDLEYLLNKSKFKDIPEFRLAKEDYIRREEFIHK